MGVNSSEQKILDSEEEFRRSFNFKLKEGETELIDKENFARFSLDVHDWANKVREDPEFIIPYLEKRKENFDWQDKKFLWNSSTMITSGDRTYEGVEAFTEAIEFLKGRSAMKKLVYSDPLIKMSKDQHQQIVKEQGERKVLKDIVDKLKTEKEKKSAMCVDAVLD